MGADHARLLSTQVAGASVGYVVDFDADRAAAVAAACGPQTRSGADGAAAIADPDVDAVLVASPDRTHRELVLAAIAAGKPVLCEKPLATSAAECEEIVAAERSTGRRLVTVGFMRRFDPGYAGLRAAVVDGTHGRPLMVHNVHRNATSAVTDTATQIISTPVHEFDVVSWLLGEPITAVTVFSGRVSGQAQEGLQDPLLIVLRSASGVLADVEVYVNARYGYEVRCDLVLEQAALSLRPSAPVEVRRARTVSTPVDADWRPRFEEAYRRELQAWLGLVTGHAPDQPDLAAAADGLAALRVADACVEAFHSGATVSVPTALNTA